MIDNPRKGTMDGYRCELCGAWIEYRDLGKVLAHAARCAGSARRRGSHRPRPQKAAAGLRQSATASRGAARNQRGDVE
jgi:hypothetical protein